MEPNKKPILSIGMIFKNEIRCLERCMKALRPLRDAIPCQLVMADTGSNDGSREIAAKYADILFDFPWINDFAAARNAVMDRCTGQWYFSIDADEWLDGDISPLIKFLTDGKFQKNYGLAAITVRNYTTEDLESFYNDMLGVRLARLSAGFRYVGEIHETLKNGRRSRLCTLNQMVLHHDGYVGMDEEKGRAKRERNMALLQQDLERDPNNLRTLLECVESCGEDSLREEYLQRAVVGVEERWDTWELFGPSLLRLFVRSALRLHLPELEERAALARRIFPDSPFTTIDVSCLMLQHYILEEEYSKAIAPGQEYLRALKEYRKGGKAATATLFSVLLTASVVQEQQVRIYLADAYFHEGDYKKALEVLSELDGAELNAECTRDYVKVLLNIHIQGPADLSEEMAAFWAQISTPKPSAERAGARKKEVAAAAGQAFTRRQRELEEAAGQRHGYSMFLPLEGECETGRAAAILETRDAKLLEERLAGVQEWDLFPIHALAYALLSGARFPLPESPMQPEALCRLAGRMTRVDEDFVPVVLKCAAYAEALPEFVWVQALFGTAWAEWEDVDQKMELVQGFAALERRCLPRYYAPAALSEEGLFLLPPLHRFGWYCAQAFEALESGDPAGYVRALRAGLASCESMKPVVEFLTDNTPEIQQPSQELLELAEKVRTLLSAYDPTDPAVAALKQSPAYQKVAHLIEGAEVPVVGGLVQ